MIINIVGTMGAGKTTLVRRFMERYGPDEVRDPTGRKVIGYWGCTAWQAGFFVVGNYERVSGGCDGMRTQDLVRERVRWAAERFDHVIFEGLTVTCCFGTYVDFLRKIAPGDHAFAFLHPPVEVCVERVLARRAARGDHEPFNPEGVHRHHRLVTRAIERARERGAPHVVLSWKRPLPQLERLLAGSPIADAA